MEESKILLLEQQFKNYKETTDRELKELKYTLTEQEKRISQLELNHTKTDLQYEQIIQTLNDTTIPNLVAQIEELKNKPVKRYETVIGSILGAIFGAVGGAIAGLFLK